MNPPSNPQTPHHFLFMLPDSTTPEDQERVVKSAKDLTSMGYVYIASAHEPTMEDRDDIRFMPLRKGEMPCFGRVSGVMIVRDQSLASAAQQAYPGTKVFVIDPADSPAEQDMAGQRKPRRAVGARWPQPLMQASGVQHAA